MNEAFKIEKLNDELYAFRHDGAVFRWHGVAGWMELDPIPGTRRARQLAEERAQEIKS